MLEVWTAHIDYDGPDKFDITVKSGDLTFAPEWRMVMGHKMGTLSDEDYTYYYVRLMRKSLRENSEKWKELFSRERVVLVCYCKSGKFCHRILLAKMLEKSGAKYMGEIEVKK